MADAAIDLSGIVFAFDRPLIDGLSLAVQSGEVVVLLGGNGAGKTTLLRIASGDLRPRAGRALVLGKDPRLTGTRRLMGVVSEVPVLDGHLKPGESIRCTLAVYGAPPQRRAEIPEGLARFGLAGSEKKRIGALSKGMTRRLELLTLVLVDPPVWVLDEPDSGLDPGGARLFREEIAKARGRGRAILFSTHSVVDAAQCADKFVVMRSGRISCSGTRDEIMQRLNKRAFVAEGGGAGVAAALLAAAAAHGAALSGPEVPVAALESLLFEDGGA